MNEILEKIKAYYIADDVDAVLSYVAKLQKVEQENEQLKISVRYWEDKYQNTKFTDDKYKQKLREAKDLFYETCRISQDGVYKFNKVDYEQLDKVLSDD